MYMKEFELLPRQLPSLRDCGFYVSGFNPVVDTTVLPLGMVVMKVSPDTLGKPYSRQLAWALRRFSRPPYGTVFQVEAGGEIAGAAASAGLRVAHPDGYWLTAAAAAACLLQWLDGSLREPDVTCRPWRPTRRACCATCTVWAQRCRRGAWTSPPWSAAPPRPPDMGEGLLRVPPRGAEDCP